MDEKTTREAKITLQRFAELNTSTPPREWQKLVQQAEMSTGVYEAAKALWRVCIDTHDRELAKWLLEATGGAENFERLAAAVERLSNIAKWVRDKNRNNPPRPAIMGLPDADEPTPTIADYTLKPEQWKAMRETARYLADLQTWMDEANADSLNTAQSPTNYITGKLRGRLSNARPNACNDWEIQQAADDLKRLKDEFRALHGQHPKPGTTMPRDVFYLLDAIENWMSEYRQNSAFFLHPDEACNSLERFKQLERRPVSLDLFSMCDEWRAMILQYYPPKIEYTPEHAKSLDQIAFEEWQQEHPGEVAQMYANEDEALRAYDEPQADDSVQQQATQQPTASTPAAEEQTPPVQLPPRFADDPIFCSALDLAEQAGIIERDGNRYRPGTIKGKRVTDADICFLIASRFCGDAVVPLNRHGKKHEYVKGREGNFPGKETAQLFGENARKWERPRQKFPTTIPRLYEAIENIYRQAESSL